VSHQLNAPSPFADKAATNARPAETTGLTPAEIRRIVLDVLG